MESKLSDSATDIFDQHPLWEDLETVEAWLNELSEKFDPAYVGLPELASDFLRRIDIVIRTTRLYLNLADKETVSSSFLDELRTSLLAMAGHLQQITWDDENDYDQELSDANKAADSLLTSLYNLAFLPIDLSSAVREADIAERARVQSFLEKSQVVVHSLTAKEEELREQLEQNKQDSKEALADLRSLIEEVAESFKDEIDEGVEAGRKRIDDQIVTLQNQYNSEIEKQKSTAQTQLEAIMADIKRQKDELDAMVEKTQTISGYVAEAAMSRMFREQADEAKKLWNSFTIAASVVTLLTVILLFIAGTQGLGADATLADVVRATVRLFFSLGAGALAAYLFRQAAAQQRRFQDSRSAEVRLGSMDAFLAQFEEDEAQEIRRGVGQRVYIDGELGEVSRGDQAGRKPVALAPKDGSNGTQTTAPQGTHHTVTDED